MIKYPRALLGESWGKWSTIHACGWLSLWFLCGKLMPNIHLKHMQFMVILLCDTISSFLYFCSFNFYQASGDNISKFWDVIRRKLFCNIVLFKRIFQFFILHKSEWWTNNIEVHKKLYKKNVTWIIKVCVQI